MNDETLAARGAGWRSRFVLEEASENEKKRRSWCTDVCHMKVRPGDSLAIVDSLLDDGLVSRITENSV